MCNRHCCGCLWYGYVRACLCVFEWYGGKVVVFDEVVCVCVCLFCLLFIRCGEGSVLAERKGGHWVCARLIRKRWF